MTASKARSASLASAALASAATTTAWPLRTSVVATLYRIISLSSMTRILLMLSAPFLKIQSRQRRLGRQAQLDARAAFAVLRCLALDGDVAAVGIHDSVNDRQAQAGAASPGCEERVEDPTQRIGPNARTRILDAEHDARLQMSIRA